MADIGPAPSTSTPPRRRGCGRPFLFLLLLLVLIGGIVLYLLLRRGGEGSRQAGDTQGPAAVVPTPTDLVPIASCRLLDTRSGAPLAAQSTRTIQVAGSCGIPFTAKAVALSLTTSAATGDGYLTMWPANIAKPSTSVIHFSAGKIRSNNAILALSTDGAGELAAEASMEGNGTVHLILDVTGYFQ